MENARSISPLQIRMPSELHDYLKKAAKKNMRPLNSEIVSRLLTSLSLERADDLGRRTAEEKVLADIRNNIVLDPETGCHLFQGSIGGTGYGQIHFMGKTWTTHRLMYVLTNGPIPEEKANWHVCHKCDVPACCNPEHLYLGTPQQNARDRANRCRMKTGFRLFSRLTDDEANEPFGTVFYEYKEEIRTLHEWAQLFKLHPTTLQLRFDAGWSEADILSRPGHGVRRRKGVNQYRRFYGEAAVRRYLAEKESAQTNS